MRWRFFILVLVMLAALAFVLLHAAGWLSFAELKAHHGDLQAGVQAWPVMAPLFFFGVFVLCTSLSLPVATLLTLMAGSLFGFWQALLLVCLASSTGATMAMLMSRYFLRRAVEKRWPHWVGIINKGLAKDGVFYLFALRLAPTPPYFVVNLLMGLTREPAWRFFLVSLIGMLPLDAVFVNAGRTLATLQSPEDILDAYTVLALLLAGLLPLLLRWLMNRYRPLKDAEMQG